MANGAATQLESLLKLRHAAKEIAVFTRQRSRSQLAGSSKTLFRGRGLEFEEVRHYQAGDELRAIDWRVTARSGVAHTKLFREERERPVFVMVDLRESMAFGSQRCFKSVQAAEVAALVGWAALQHNDRVGGLVFNASRHTEIRPARNRAAVLHLINSMHAYACELVQPATNKAAPDHPSNAASNTGKTSLATMLAELRRVARPGSAAFVLSDFADFDHDCIKHLHQLARHCDVNAIMLYDPMEQTLPSRGLMAFTDGQQRIEVDTAASYLQQEYSGQFVQRVEHLRSELGKLAIDLKTLSTGDNALDALLAWYRPARNPHRLQSANRASA